MPRTYVVKPPIERFLKHINKTETCWLWVGNHYSAGYGQFWLNNKRMGAHVASWILYQGDVPDALQVQHLCNIRECVNPEHLTLGTPKQNSAYMVESGRQSKGEAHSAKVLPNRPRGDNNTSRLYPERLPRGERHGNAILTEAIVKRIRIAHERGDIYLKIAARFGISKSTVGKVVTRTYWKHVA